MDEDLETPEPEQHPAERRIENRENDKAQRELAVVDAVPGLNKAQRTAVLANVGKDATVEEMQSMARELGFAQNLETKDEPTGETPDEPSAEQKAEMAMFGNMQAAAAGAFTPAPQPTGADKILSVYERAQRIANPAELVKLRPELEQAITAAGLQFGEIDHDGQFTSV